MYHMEGGGFIEFLSKYIGMCNIHCIFQLFWFHCISLAEQLLYKYRSLLSKYAIKGEFTSVYNKTLDLLSQYIIKGEFTYIHAII